jgi:hypothetical protein
MIVPTWLPLAERRARAISIGSSRQSRLELALVPFHEVNPSWISLSGV